MAAYFEQVLGGTYDNHVLPFLWLKGEERETITEYLEQIAGADIREFGKPPVAPILPEVCRAIENLDKPVVAVLHGAALNSGMLPGIIHQLGARAAASSAPCACIKSFSRLRMLMRCTSSCEKM